MTPLRLFRSVAVAEAVTWALLLLGMVLKYVTHTTDLGVRVFGLAHGVVFIAYCLTTLVVAVDARWRPGRAALGLFAAIPPFATVLFDAWAERRGMLGARWRLGPGGEAGRTAPERLVATALARPGAALAGGVVAVALLTAVALLAGPPGGQS